ncbi:MAG: hypothetical protein WA664_06250, partial [Candidatus Acidiferrales bacterium]
RMDDAGKPTADSDGGIWMEISDANGTSKVGLSVNNIFAQGSDPRLAFELLLARVAYVLKSPKHSRETMLEFKEDWALLQYAHMRISAASATGESSEFHGQVARTPAGGAE